MCPCLFFRREKLKGLKLYEINPLYIKYLAQYQKHIFWSDGNKATRKYIGIVLQIDGMNYFAPLSSFKPKHTKMKESVDFIKIRNIAVINVNNMVPVPNEEYHLVDINGIQDQHYRYLLQAENREINRLRDRIIKSARVVYNHKIQNGMSTALARRTNDFKQLEKKCKEY